MVTRRRLLESGIGGGAGLAMAACGAGQAGSGGAPPAGQLKAGSTLVYWNDQGGAYPDLMTRWGARFKEETGVNVEVTGGVTEYANKLTGAFAAGSPPDVFRYLQEQIPMPGAVERNMLMKLDDYVKRDKYDLNDFRKDSIELYRWKGVLYGLPRDYGLQLVFYNTEVFQKAGVQPIPADWNDKTWTFQKFVETCVQVARTTGGYAMVVPTGRRLWASFVYSNGGNVVKRNNEGVATEFALTDKTAVDALQLMQDLIYKHKVAPEPSQVTPLGLNNQPVAMASGQLAMQITNPGGRGNYIRAGVPFDVGVFPLGGASRRGVGGGGTGWAGAATGKLPEEAWAFLKVITSKQAQLDEVAIGQTTPSRTSVALSKEFLDPTTLPKNAKVFADGQEYVVRDPVHAKWPDVEREVLTPTFNQQLWTGQLSAAQALKEVKDKGDSYFK